MLMLRNAITIAEQCWIVLTHYIKCSITGPIGEKRHKWRTNKQIPVPRDAVGFAWHRKSLGTIQSKLVFLFLSGHCMSLFNHQRWFLTFQITNASQCKLGDTVCFTGPPKCDQKLWPAHCVQESWGSEFHKDLIVSEIYITQYVKLDLYKKIIFRANPQTFWNSGFQ